MRFALGVTCVLLICATCAGPGAVSERGVGSPRLEGERRTFSIGERDGITFTVPPGWKVRSTKAGPDLPLSLRIDPPEGGALFVVPSSSGEGKAAADPLVSARMFAAIAKRRALHEGADPDLPIHKLERSDDDRIRGFFFVAKEKNFVKPPAGTERWSDMLRGAAAVGRLLVTFTWFDDGPGPDRDKVLELMRGAQQVASPETSESPRSPPDEGKLSLEPAPEIVTTPLAVASPNGAFTVLVDLPGFKMYQPRSTPDGTGMLLVGEHPETGLVASVTVGLKERSVNALACRAEKVRALKASAPDLTDLKTSEEGPVARVRYVLHELKGEKVPQEHAHAFLARDGACIDVHVSKAAPDPGDEARINGILGTVRFAVEL